MATNCKAACSALSSARQKDATVCPSLRPYRPLKRRCALTQDTCCLNLHTSGFFHFSADWNARQEFNASLEKLGRRLIGLKFDLSAAEWAKIMVDWAASRHPVDQRCRRGPPSFSLMLVSFLSCHLASHPNTIDSAPRTSSALAGQSIKERVMGKGHL